MKATIVLLVIGLLAINLLQQPKSPYRELETDDKQFITAKREPTMAEVIEYNWNGNSQQAYAIFRCESGLQEKAVGPTQDYGVAQIHLPSHRGKVPGETDSEKIEWLFDYKNNLRLAKQIYDASGWYPWVCARNLGIV